MGHAALKAVGVICTVVLMVVVSRACGTHHAKVLEFPWRELLTWEARKDIPLTSNLFL